MPLTKRQSEILGYLHGHIQQQGYAPSFEEIAEKFGFQSLATVHEHLTNLERKGYTLVPLDLHWKEGRAKLEIGLAKGKKQHDKRATEKDRDWQRDKARVMRRG